MKKKVSTTVYLEPGQVEQLAALSKLTKVPTAEYIRQGIDLLLEAKRDVLNSGPDALAIFDSWVQR